MLDFVPCGNADAEGLRHLFLGEIVLAAEVVEIADEIFILIYALLMT